MQDNLKLWLRTWLLRNSRVSGQVLPASWIGIQRLDELPRFISRNCGVVWRDNAPRHSYASYFFRLCKDAGTVVKSMGTSLDKFEKHYWCKAESITDEAAREWFGIVPPGTENVLPMSATGKTLDPQDGAESRSPRGSDNSRSSTVMSKVSRAA